MFKEFKQMHHTIAFYNVENLYDIVKDKNKLDDDYTYYGKKSWTLNRYKHKLIKIAKTISLIGEEETSRLPTFFGLCEIENKKVIEELLKEFPFRANYGYVHTDSLDERGIDTVFFYNKEFFTLEKYDFIRIPVYNNQGVRDYTRDITYAQGKFVGKDIHFFVLHLPSKRENDSNKPKRIVLLHKLRERIDEIFNNECDAQIIIMGDLNENPTAEYLTKELHCKKYESDLNSTDFYNPYENLYSERKYSTYHHKKGLLFDQILLSASFFNKESQLIYKKAEIFNKSYLQNKERGKLGTPWRTYTGSRYLGGYSDHYPVYVVIETANQG